MFEKVSGGAVIAKPKMPHENIAPTSSPSHLALWHFHAQARVYHDTIVQVSDDKDFKSGVTTIYNNDHDNSAKMGKGSDMAYIEDYKGRIIDGKGSAGRYVRFYSNGNTSDELNHYTEIEVFGQAK